jgi:hypothetical protein
MCCCKCCTCCCGSSGGSGRSGHKRMKSEPTPTYPAYGANPHAGNPYAQAHSFAPPAPLDPRPLNQQYRSHDAPAFTPAPTYVSTAPERPQFATFEAHKPVNEDALPVMPTWGDARDRHIEVEEQPLPQKRGDMELDRLDHNGSVTNGSMTGMAAVGGARRSPAPTRSPVSPADGYGYNQGFEKEPLVGGGPHRSPYSSPAPQGRPYAQQDEYRRNSPAQNLSPVYGAGEGYAQSQPYGRHSPAQQQQQQQQTSYNQQDEYNYQDSYAQVPRHSPAPPAQNYNDAPRYHSPSPPAQDYNNNTQYDNYAPAPVQPPSLTPGYPQSEPPMYEQQEPAAQPVSAYPGQRSYTPQAQTSYPGQKTYQAFQPGQN